MCVCVCVCVCECERERERERERELFSFMHCWRDVELIEVIPKHCRSVYLSTVYIVSFFVSFVKRGYYEVIYGAQTTI